MPDLRLPVAAVLCGAGLLGFSISGVASVRDQPLPHVQTKQVSHDLGGCERPEEI